MIELKDLHYRLNGKEILKDINLSVKEGDFWLIFGPNGAGKTTLLKILCGLIHQYQGQALIHGKDIKSLSIRELAALISYQPQFEEFSLPISIKDILLAGRYPYKSFFKNYSDEDYRIFHQVVKELELESFLDRDINTLSGGEKRKVVLASAFIQDVSIILFDEPFTFLDPEAISLLKKMMIRLNQMGKTLLVVSHDFELLFPIVNKIFALKKGSIVYSGDKVFDRQILHETYHTKFDRIVHEGKEIIFLDE
ncbi:MAG: ABC transporter ATP-binding protein [Acidobacteria bacterium]|jgi:iron complex transport system ATP-binding protein|nr:ABC transporter ATP-binding protein [Acidobacteriota bacterium]